MVVVMEVVLVLRSRVCESRCWVEVESVLEWKHVTGGVYSEAWKEEVGPALGGERCGRDSGGGQCGVCGVGRLRCSLDV